MTNKAKREVTLLAGPAGLAALEQEWRALEQSTPLPFYASWRWHHAWLSTLEPEPEKIQFAVLRENGRCAGILPLLPNSDASRRWQPALLEVPRRTGMDLCTPIMASGKSLADWWPTLRKTLKQAGHRAFIIRMTGVPLEPERLAPLRQMASRKILRVQNHSCWIDCRRSHADVSSRYSTRLRKILRRGERKLAAAGQLTFTPYHGQQAIDEAYPIFLRLEASGWKGKSGTALALDDRSRRFHETFLFAEETLPELRINLLHAGEHAVAGQLCITRHGIVSVLKITYDQSWSKASPGSVMMDRLLRQSCADPEIHAMSFITGQRWMDEWRPEKTEVADIWLFDRAIDATLARGAAGLRDRLRRLRETTA